jgi:endoglucanase
LVFTLIILFQQENNIPYQLRNGVKGGTNAYAIQTTFTGAETYVISTPCRYIHSPRSIANVDDIINTYKLADALLRKALYED